MAAHIFVFIVLPSPENTRGTNHYSLRCSQELWNSFFKHNEALNWWWVRHINITDITVPFLGMIKGEDYFRGCSVRIRHWEQLNCSLHLWFNPNIIGDISGKCRDTGHCQTPESRITGRDTLFRRVTYIVSEGPYRESSWFCLMECTLLKKIVRHVEKSLIHNRSAPSGLHSMSSKRNELQFCTTRRPPAAADQCECCPQMWFAVGMMESATLISILQRLAFCLYGGALQTTLTKIGTVLTPSDKEARLTLSGGDGGRRLLAPARSSCPHVRALWYPSPTSDFG